MGWKSQSSAWEAILGSGVAASGARAIVDAALDAGAFVPYSPLANGLLTGKYRRGEVPADDTRLGNIPARFAEQWLSERRFDRLDTLEAFARDRGHALIELAFAWLLASPK